MSPSGDTSEGGQESSRPPTARKDLALASLLGRQEPGLRVGSARNHESSPMCRKIRPSREPSAVGVAQPRPLAGSLSSLPSHENSMPGRPSRSTSRMSAPALDSDEPEVAVVARSDLDERRAQEVDGVLIPKLHLDDAPAALEAHRSSLGPCRSNPVTRRPTSPCSIRTGSRSPSASR